MAKGWENTENINENSVNNGGVVGSDNGYQKPTSLITALAEVQRTYVIEDKSTEDLPKEYFTIEQIFDFFKVGFRSGFIESFLFVTLFPFLQTIYPSVKLYFFNIKITQTEQLLLNSISYLPMLFMTVFLLFLSKYYVGALTRRALFALFSGRSMAFLIKGLIIYFLFNYLSKISYVNPNVIYSWVDFTKWLFDIFLPFNISNQDLYIYYYKFITPALTQTAENILYTMLFFAILPYLTIFFKGMLMKKKHINSIRAYEEY